MHVADGARLGQEVGLTGSVTRVDGDGTSSRGSHPSGEVAPVRDRAETFVEEDEFGSIGLTGDSEQFEAATENSERGVLVRSIRFSHQRVGTRYSRKNTSGAKASSCFALSARLKPCPDTNHSRVSGSLYETHAKHWHGSATCIEWLRYRKL